MDPHAPGGRADPAEIAGGLERCDALLLPGGTVEAVERPGWLVAVQWHPDDTAATDATSRARFEALIGEARRR
jgi:hypothetical protein